MTATRPPSASGRFDPFAKPSRNDRRLRTAVVYCVGLALSKSPASPVRRPLPELCRRAPPVHRGREPEPAEIEATVKAGVEVLFRAYGVLGALPNRGEASFNAASGSHETRRRSAFAGNRWSRRDCAPADCRAGQTCGSGSSAAHPPPRRAFRSRLYIDGVAPDRLASVDIAGQHRTDPLTQKRTPKRGLFGDAPLHEFPEALRQRLISLHHFPNAAAACNPTN
jgi:hypothetical protein